MVDIKQRLKETLRLVWKGKEGIIIGAVSGYITHEFVLPYSGYTFSIVNLPQSTFETVTSIQIDKVLVTFIIVGIIVGFILDLNKERLPQSIRRFF